MVFTGTYQRSIDGKLRVLLPKRLRSGLAGMGSDVETKLFLTPGTDHCLELHTSQSLNELAQRASQSQAGSKSVRSFSRLFYARAQQCDVDKQGRIRIPGELAQLADLSTEVVFIGVGFHWELWNLELWEAYLKQNDDAFDQIADATFDGSFVAAEQPPIAESRSPELNVNTDASVPESDRSIPSMSIQQKQKPK